VGKLVRDRIPEIIRADGREPVTYVLEAPDYEAALLQKLVEEAEELRTAPESDRLDEAADVYEVLLAVAAHLGITLDQVAARAAKKRDERGGFTNRIWLDG
jgi:predicted house-cleaning noncanonical NTP pyrophosphatase (MazG superfamily)